MGGCGWRIKSKAHLNRKMKKAGSGVEGEKEELMQFIQRFHSMFNQTTTEIEDAVLVVFQNYFSRFFPAFGCCAYIGLASHFLSHLSLKEHRQYLWRQDTWLNILTIRSLAACNGKAPVERHLEEQDIYSWLQ